MSTTGRQEPHRKTRELPKTTCGSPRGKKPEFANRPCPNGLNGGAVHKPPEAGNVIGGKLGNRQHEFMTTYSVRCRHYACRHRRVTKKHPDDYKVAPACLQCGNRKGWRVEGRAYNRRGLCNCSGVDMVRGVHFPHRVTHPFCDQNPLGFYNQARAQGVAHEDIPVEFGGGLIEEAA